jgi:hypothetical protein
LIPHNKKGSKLKMADEMNPPADDVDAVVEETGFPDPDEFENFDEVDSTTVVLPEDSFDVAAATDKEGCGCE